ncbi:unnamed protein product [marine sediment metagenome]|uniref:Uncharacterized protein n=1 Tax=marine sediment metagenome TaxID=412755 RepID=X1PS46_9ZZZZ
MAYRLITDFVYSLGETYEGPAVLSIFEFSTPPGIFADMIADKMIDGFEDKCREEGLDILRMKVWADTSPILETKFYAEFSCYSAEVESPVPPLVIVALERIIAALPLIILAVIFYLSIRVIRDIFYSPAGPKVAEALKWLGIGLGIIGGGVIVSKLLPKRAEEAKV